MCAEAGLQDARDETPDPRRQRAGQDGQRGVDEPGQAVHGITDDGGCQAADKELSLGANVEQIALETDRHSQPGKHIRD
jgi:hypothetical protein